MSGRIRITARRKGVAAIAAAAFFVVPASTFGAACKQEQAVYVDRDGAYELRFAPLNSPSAAASNQFKVSAEVADAILYLLSPSASYITGAILNVSGGR
ncbi:hypothetical protein ELI20_21440 [Rhizobium ruizarguesonis]|nr:hypothetical protein ELI20_21440 [Rhizobium ruizarguesonis]